MTLARGEIDLVPTYADDYRGWPTAPKQQAHGVYGTFLNPTMAWRDAMPEKTVGYHTAIDVLVNDAAGHHPVFAVEGGRVHEAHIGHLAPPGKDPMPCGVVGIRHFRYAHIIPEVEVGETVEPGQRIGHTCGGWWHVHLEEYVTVGGKRIAVNPMRPGGKLTPFVDTGKPVVKELRIYPKEAENDPTPTPLPLDRVRGTVVPVALAHDLLPLREWPKAPVVPLHVYRARIELKRGSEVVLARRLFQVDSAPGPTWQHFFRPLTRRSAPIATCIEQRPKDCTGRFWLRLWERGWNTRQVPNGQYALTVTVEDTVGREASRTLRFRVAN